MPQFIVNPGTPSAWELPLQPGTIRLGRNADNDVQIEAGTVSGTHCTITLNGDTVTVKDLGSTNGTFINGAPIQEAVLEAGQTLHLGGVEMAFYAELPAAAAEPPPPAPRIALARPEASAPPPPSAAAPDSISCPGCGNPLAPRAILCTKCGYNLRTGQRMPNYASSGVRTRGAAARTASGPGKWWQSPGLYIGVFGGILALLYVAARLHPLGVIAFLGFYLLFTLVVNIMVLVAAFREDVGTGFMTLCIPFYALIFVFNKSESTLLKGLYAVNALATLAMYTLKGME